MGDWYYEGRRGAIVRENLSQDPRVRNERFLARSEPVSKQYSTTTYAYPRGESRPSVSEFIAIVARAESIQEVSWSP